MMNPEIPTSKDVVAALLRFDEMPPDDDYSPFSYGEEIAQKVQNESHAGRIVSDVVRQSPSGLASSFVEGLLTKWNTEYVRRSLMQSLPHVRELTSAANVVELIRTEFGVADDAILSEVLFALDANIDSSQQERLCFATWALICGETYNVENQELRSGSKDIGQSQIANLLNRSDLNDYCVSVLKQCADTMNKRDRNTTTN